MEDNTCVRVHATLWIFEVDNGAKGCRRESYEQEHMKAQLPGGGAREHVNTSIRKRLTGRMIPCLCDCHSGVGADLCLPPPSSACVVLLRQYAE